MTFEGTVSNGVIVLDGGAQLPEGVRVRVEVAEDDALAAPPEPHNRAQEVALLRAALADVRAGRGALFEDFMAKLAAAHKLPPRPLE